MSCLHRPCRDCAVNGCNTGGLDLSCNLLSERLPVELGNLTAMQDFRISQDRLTGMG